MAEVIRFRLKQNVLCDIDGEGTLFQPRHQNVEIDTPLGPALVAQFDLSVVHTITLADDDEPRDLVKSPKESQAWFDKRLDAEMNRAIEAGAKNAAIRKRVDAYVKAGVIELVQDNAHAQPSTKGKA